MPGDHTSRDSSVFSFVEAAGRWKLLEYTISLLELILVELAHAVVVLYELVLLTDSLSTDCHSHCRLWARLHSEN